MKVLIGCEQSGIFRRAFAALGHDAWSCDIDPAEDGSNHHIRGDIRDHLGDGWDLLVVAHPPCTRLCNSGVRWLHEAPANPPEECTAAEKFLWSSMSAETRRRIMWRLLDEGAALFADCWDAPVERVAIENPVMNPYARERLPAGIPKPHIVQPWWFGDPAKKATGWYLRGLPPLVETNRLTPPPKGSDEDKRWQAVHRMPPGPDRRRLRSRSFPGMAAAAARQWGDHAAEHLRRAV